MITLQNIAELVAAARATRYAGYTFEPPMLGGFSVVWSSVSSTALLTISTAAGQVEQLDIRADETAAASIWRAIAERASLFTLEDRHVGS